MAFPKALRLSTSALACSECSNLLGHRLFQSLSKGSACSRRRSRPRIRPWHCPKCRRKGALQGRFPRQDRRPPLRPHLNRSIALISRLPTISVRMGRFTPTPPGPFPLPQRSLRQAHQVAVRPRNITNLGRSWTNSIKWCAPCSRRRPSPLPAGPP